MPNPYIATLPFATPSIPAAPVPVIPADATRSLTLVDFGDGNPIKMPVFTSPHDPAEDGDACVVAERIAFGFAG